jgi:hypothetical protein
MTLAIAVAIAVSFWGARKIETPCKPIVTVVREAELPVVNGRPALAAAIPSQCRVLVGPELQDWRHRDPGYYATVIVHEVGHIDGIGHSPGGFMDENGFDPLRSMYPTEVRRYVSRMRGVCIFPGGGYIRANDPEAEDYAYCSKQPRRSHD